MSILEVIEQERPKHQTVLECRYITKEAFNAALDRIAEAARQPRVMKPWMDDCKPEKDSLCIICIVAKDGSDLILDDPIRITTEVLESGFIDGYKINYWLKHEPTSVLPDKIAEKIARGEA